MKFLAVSVVLLFFLRAEAQYNIDSLFNSLTEKQRIALLFVSNEIQNGHPDAGLSGPVKYFSALPDNDSRSFIDVSEGFSDKYPVGFPSYNTLRFVSDTALLKKLFKATAKYFLCEGSAGILYRYSDNKDVSTPPYHLITLSPSGLKITDVAFFDNLPLQKMINGDERLFPGAEVDFPMPQEKDSFGTKSEEQLPGASFEDFLEKGMLFYSDHTGKSIIKVMKALDNRILDREKLYRYARRALLLRMNGEENIQECNVEKLKEAMLKARWEAVFASINVIQKRRDINEGGAFLSVGEPYSVLDLSGEFNKIKSRYRSPENIYRDTSDAALFSAKRGKLVLILSNKDDIPEELIRKLWKNNILYLVYLNGPKCFKERLLPFAGYFDKIMFVPSGDKLPQSIIDQVVFGGVCVNRNTPLPEELVKAGFGKASYEKTRIGYAFPEITGMNSDSLKKIDSILNVVVKNRMSPGGQVLVVKNGYVVYDKPFGYMTYGKKQKVDRNKIYDLASLTKIISTIPLVMELYDRHKIALDSTLSTYLPELDTLETGRLTLRQILLHEAGFPSYIPFHFDYIDKKSYRGSMYSGRYSGTYNIRLDRFFYFNKYVRYRKDVFRRTPDTLFNIRLSRNFYMNYHYLDSIQDRVSTVKLKKKKDYLYSDLGYFFLQRIIENTYGKSLDKVFEQEFTKPLGLQHLLYLPLKRYTCKEIVSSGRDATFRKEMICGYPNDKGAAMLGGVAGHAGLFGNADDIAVFASMLINEGKYGGKQFIKSSTVELFTSKQNDHNRRGLGFDKPEFDPEKDTPASVYVSPSSYGHSGYTGTFLWIDPEYDLIYIFLSNRVYPDNYNRKLIKENIRTEIQDIIYRSFLSKEIIQKKEALRHKN